MDFVAIPSDVFRDPKYAGMTHTERDFLIHLYYKFADCESFTLDRDQITDYWKLTMSDIYEFSKRLIDAGLIVRVGSLEANRCGPKPRVFSFKYPASSIYEKAAV